MLSPPHLPPLLCSFLSSFLPFSPSFLSFSCSKNPKLLCFPHFPLVFILLFPLVPARPFCHFVSLFQSLFILSPPFTSLDEVLLKKCHCPGLSCCCPAAASLMHRGLCLLFQQPALHQGSLWGLNLVITLPLPQQGSPTGSQLWQSHQSPCHLCRIFLELNSRGCFWALCVFLALIWDFSWSIEFL